MTSVPWTKMGAANKPSSERRILRSPALQQQVARASPLVSDHVTGELNVLGEIPSHSFGYYKQWNCTNDSKFLSLINYQFPLPHQRSCKGLRLSFALSTKVISDIYYCMPMIVS